MILYRCYSLLLSQQYFKCNFHCNYRNTPRILYRKWHKKYFGNKITFLLQTWYILDGISLISLFKLKLGLNYSQTNMLNSQPNININIVCNMPLQKIIKKSKTKSSGRINKGNQQSIMPYDIEIKMNHKNAQNNNKKSNQARAIHEGKKHKKKVKNMLKNSFSPQVYVQKKVKERTIDVDLEATIKKDSKNKWPHKSNQIPCSKIIQSFRKSHLAKTPKSFKKDQTSMVLNQKRYKTQANEPFQSQFHSKSLKKKKSSSLFKGGYNKILNKLLDISELTYEINNSLPMVSQRDSLSSHSKNLKEYMSSVDIKIFQNLQQDAPIFSKDTITHKEYTIKIIMKAKEISLQELTRKVVLIQRAWRRINKNKIIGQYKYMFAQATQKLIKERHQALVNGQSDFLGIQAVSKDIFSQLFKDDQLCFDRDSLKEDLCSVQIPTNMVFQYPQELIGSHNLCKPLDTFVLKKIGVEASFSPSNLHSNQSSIKNKQMQQWNNINKKISNLMNGNQMNSNGILQDLISQSNRNKQWIEDSLNEQEQVNQIISPRSSEHYDISCDYSYSFNNYPHISKVQKDQEEDSMQNTDQYDFNKYKTSAQIQQSLSNNEVIKDYLDCGLSSFSLQRYQQMNFNLKDHEIMFNQILDKNESHLQIEKVIAQKMQNVNSMNQEDILLLDDDGQIKIQDQSQQKQDIFQARMTKTIVWIVQYLINEFSYDIGYILKKATQPQITPKVNLNSKNKQVRTNKVKKDPFVNGIKTNIQSIQEYVTRLIEYALKDQQNVQKIHKNINMNVGPSSIEILSYLRSDYNSELFNKSSEQSVQDENGLFVIPAEMFDSFQKVIEDQYFTNKVSVNQRIRAYLNFWNRCIFQSYNEYLDYQRPFGTEGEPYIWLKCLKRYKAVEVDNIKEKLLSGKKRLMNSTSLVAGIIFQKGESPFSSIQISQQQRFQINEERQQRILANQLLQSQNSWQNLNDELAQISTELSDYLSDKLLFELSADLKRLQRKRKLANTSISQC